MMVAFYHASRHLDEGVGAPTLRSILQFGHSGVNFFFVLSGFIILYVHRRDVGNPSRLRRYIVRRITRLWPIYLVIFGSILLLNVIKRHQLPPVGDLMISLFLLPSDKALIVPVAWTLQYELLFYTIFGILIVNRRTGLSVMAIWFVVSMTGIGNGMVPSQLVSTWNLEFFIGMAVALLIQEGVRVPARVILLCGLAAFSAVALAEDLSWIAAYSVMSDCLYGISAGMIILGGVSSDQTGKIAVPQSLQRVGGATYAIYLFHLLIIGAVWQAALMAGLATPAFAPVLFAVMAVAVVVGGVLVSEWVEQPLIHQARALLDRRQRALLIKNPHLRG
jgi:exopolysaccharide production protein ExoZ